MAKHLGLHRNGKAEGLLKLVDWYNCRNTCSWRNKCSWRNGRADGIGTAGGRTDSTGETEETGTPHGTATLMEWTTWQRNKCDNLGLTERLEWVVLEELMEWEISKSSVLSYFSSRSGHALQRWDFNFGSPPPPAAWPAHQTQSLPLTCTMDFSWTTEVHIFPLSTLRQNIRVHLHTQEF